MKTGRKILSIAAVLLITVWSVSCSSGPKNEILISGKVFNGLPGKLTLREQLHGKELGPEQDIEIKDSTFQQSVLVKEPGVYRLKLVNEKDSVWQDIILDSTDVRVSFNFDSSGEWKGAEIEGSPERALSDSVRKMVYDTMDVKLKELNSKLELAKKSGDQKGEEEIRKERKAYMSEKKEQAISFLMKQPVSVGTLNELQNLIEMAPEKYQDSLEKTTLELAKKYPNSATVKEFTNEMERIKKVAVGQPAPAISLTNPEGKEIALADLRGKYVLVDFWASWCYPCRHENPFVLSAYKKFQKKGFEVYAVSLDESKENWLKAVQEDKLVYNNVSDLKGFDGEVAVAYNIRYIPQSFLLDKEGVIVAKNLRGLELEEKLKQVLTGNLSEASQKFNHRSYAKK